MDCRATGPRETADGGQWHRAAGGARGPRGHWLSRRPVSTAAALPGHVLGREAWCSSLYVAMLCSVPEAVHNGSPRAARAGPAPWRSTPWPVGQPFAESGSY